jgi:hypothetical protein
MTGTILAGAAGVVAAPVVGGLAWRTARQRRVAKTLRSRRPIGSWSNGSKLLCLGLHLDAPLPR